MEDGDGCRWIHSDGVDGWLQVEYALLVDKLSKRLMKAIRSDFGGVWQLN